MAKFIKKTHKKPVPHKVLSDRGVLLENAHLNGQGTSVSRGQVAVIGEKEDGSPITVDIGDRCPKCRKRVRGPNHAEGSHHNGTVKRHTRR